MKWKHTTPKIGDERTKVKMAWLPTKLDDGYTVWLETYEVLLQYQSRLVPTKFFLSVRRDCWTAIRTKSLDRFLYE